MPPPEPSGPLPLDPVKRVPVAVTAVACAGEAVTDPTVGRHASW